MPFVVVVVAFTIKLTTSRCRLVSRFTCLAYHRRTNDSDGLSGFNARFARENPSFGPSDDTRNEIKGSTGGRTAGADVDSPSSSSSSYD
uniref:Putative secreted protein n=1 Tax=Anopheles darlingi TaxID=43151 RepID=A0A2M4DLN8_ANODA